MQELEQGMEQLPEERKAVYLCSLQNFSAQLASLR
jgi:hypothetical protein